MNLQEYSKGALFYILLASLFGAARPDCETDPLCFFID